MLVSALDFDCISCTAGLPRTQWCECDTETGQLYGSARCATTPGRPQPVASPPTVGETGAGRTLHSGRPFAHAKDTRFSLFKSSDWWSSEVMSGESTK